MKLTTAMKTKRDSETQVDKEVFLVDQTDEIKSIFPIRLFSFSLRFQIQVIEIKNDYLLISLMGSSIEPFTKKLMMNERYETILSSFENNEISVEFFLTSDESLCDDELILLNRHHIERTSRIKGYKLYEQIILDGRIMSEKISKLTLPKDKSLIRTHQLLNNECKSCFWIIGTRDNKFCYAIKKNTTTILYCLNLGEKRLEDYVNDDKSVKCFIFEAY